MATNNCEIYNAIRRPLDAFVKYFLDIKPYHTKLLEVLEIYNFYDTINVKIDENITKNITFLNKPLCNPTGWGVDWDDQCGFDAISCCDLFDCIGGFGLIYNNSDLLVSANVASTTTDGTITLNGNYTYDIKIPIKSIQNAEQFTVAGDQRAYFNTFNVFLIIPRHIYNITTVNNNGFTITGDVASEITARRTFIVYGSNGNDGTYIVNTASYDPSTNLTTIVVVEHINHVGGNGFIQANSSNKNNGVYQVLGTPTFNGVDTVITINGDAKRFTILNEITHGSVQFRSGLIYPRHITLTGNSSHNDGDYKILSSLYDYTTNKTTLTLSGILPDISNTGTVNLYGYEFEAGFEAGPECSIPKPSDIHMVFSERLIINVITIPITPTPTITPTITPTVTPTPTPSAVSIIPLTFNVTNSTGYQIFACGASNNASIDWGDGNIDLIPDGAPDGSDNACVNGFSHTYAVAGNYTIKIYGNYIANAGDANFGGIYMSLLPADPGGSSSTLVTWGNGNISQVQFAADIVSVPNYLPSTLIYANYMFAGTKAFNQDISSWDTSNVINMSSMFYNAAVFNQNLNTWNTGNVTDMSGMFLLAPAFNGNISSWNTSKVTNMNNMFAQAFSGSPAFNGNISSWDTSNVLDMSYMFYNATAFNQNLNTWNTLKVTNMSNMFSGATAFNGNISSWNTGSVTNMSHMFGSYSLNTPTMIFNQDISSWNTSNVMDMSGMFAGTINFNQNISGWDTANVIDMSTMFATATAFNQNLNTWNTLKVTNMSNMFSGATAFNGNISSWNTINVTNMSNMFQNASIFNIDISAWNTGSVTSMNSMFANASAFNQNLNTWNTINVTDMTVMFDRAVAFNGDVSSWNTSKVTSMYGMFSGMPLFNGNISAWNTGSVTNMGSMFAGASAFNQNISGWNTTFVTNMTNMFYQALAFNQNLSTWCVTNIPSLPSGFDTGATAWSLPRPVWGTCP